MQYFCIVFAFGIFYGIEGAIITLSPQEETFILTEDLLISFSIDEIVEGVKKIKLYFDDEDVSKNLKVMGKTISFIPDEMFLNRPDILGPHTATIILYGLYMEKIDSKTIRFYVTNTADLTNEQKMAMIEAGKNLVGSRATEFIHSGKLCASFDRQTYQNSAISVADINAYGRGYYSKWHYNYNVYLTSQQNNNQQTLHRFKFATGYTSNLILSLGDNYPSYHKFLLNDIRIRGVEVNLKTLDKWVSVDCVYGASRNPIEPFIAEPESLALRATSQKNTLEHNDSLPYFNEGTYGRNIFAGAFSLSNIKNFKIGASFVKAKDDPASIRQLYYLYPTINAASDTVMIYALAGQTPKDNIAAGVDAELYLWKKHVLLYSNYAISFITRNIDGGAISEQRVREIFGDDVSLPLNPSDIKWLLTVNETTLPLPISADSASLVNTSSLGSATVWDLGLKVDAPFGQNREIFELRYFFLGPNFRSIGNDDLVVNRKGIAVFQELRMLSGRATLKSTLTYSLDNLNFAKPYPAAALALTFAAAITPSAAYPTLIASFLRNSEATLSGASIPKERKNVFNNMGITARYGLTWAGVDNTFTLGINTSGSNVEYNNILAPYPVAFNMRSSMLSLAMVNIFKGTPWESRAGLIMSLSRDNETAGGRDERNSGINLFGLATGFSWHVVPHTTVATFDCEVKRFDSYDAVAQDKLVMRSSLTHDFSRAHSMYAEAAIVKATATSYVDPLLKATYEFSY